MERLETRLLRFVLSLPETARRRLAGRPVVRDGESLSTEARLVLWVIRWAPDPPVESVPIPRGRRILARQARVTGGTQPIGQVRDLEVPGAEGPLPARLYVPRALVSSRAPAALLVYFHGGGWIYGDLDSHDAVCRVLAEGAGCRVLSVGYRLAPEAPFPAAYEDCVTAFRWVSEHPGEVGGDRARLAVGGDSAGGALAAAVAIEAARHGWPLAFQLLVYPGTDMQGAARSRETFAEGFYLTRGFMDLARDSYLPDPSMQQDPRASVLLAELPTGLAPAYVATAGFDPLRDEGEAYADRLREAGVEVTLERFGSQIHGFLNVVGVGRDARAAVDRIAGHLRSGLASR